MRHQHTDSTLPTNAPCSHYRSPGSGARLCGLNIQADSDGGLPFWQRHVFSDLYQIIGDIHSSLLIFSPERDSHDFRMVFRVLN